MNVFLKIGSHTWEDSVLSKCGDSPPPGGGKKLPLDRDIETVKMQNDD